MKKTNKEQLIITRAEISQRQAELTFIKHKLLMGMTEVEQLKLVDTVKDIISCMDIMRNDILQQTKGF